MTLTVYSKTVCPFCVNAKNYLKSKHIPFEEINIEEDEQARQFIQKNGHRTVPQIYFEGKLFVEGGFQGLSKLTQTDIRERMNLTDLGTL
jgi:glutaredoxin 3